MKLAVAVMFSFFLCFIKRESRFTGKNPSAARQELVAVDCFFPSPTMMIQFLLFLWMKYALVKKKNYADLANPSFPH